MTETIWVALITFAAGFASSLLGLAGGMYAAKKNADTQLKQTAVQEFVKKRSDTFTEVFRAHSALVLEPINPECMMRFRTAIDDACIVASANTTVWLMLFRDTITSHNMAEIGSVKTSLALAMQKDLTVFTKPELEKNRWIEPKPGLLTRVKARITAFFVRRDRES